MERIATHGLKFDLHIHSSESSKKDGKKVSNNTLTNIPILIQKLNEQGVNICSITDHDTFSYNMYAALKQAESDDNSVQKVLPGVEFSVCFNVDGRESVVHVIAIFSDEDDEKIKSIEKLIKENPPMYNQTYKEEDFLSLLRIMNSELSKLTIKKDVQKNVSVSFDNCIESNRGSLWGNQVLSFTQN